MLPARLLPSWARPLPWPRLHSCIPLLLLVHLNLDLTGVITGAAKQGLAAQQSLSIEPWACAQVQGELR